MDWHDEDAVFNSSAATKIHQKIGKPPTTGAWREGDNAGRRKFMHADELVTENGEIISPVKIAYETWGELNADKNNAILVFHALTGDSHAKGGIEPGHLSPGWWQDIIGPGLALDTDNWFIVVPNIIGGCQGSTGPASLASDGKEWGSRFPYLSIRDMAKTGLLLQEYLNIKAWAVVIGGSMGGMVALEYGIMFHTSVQRLAIIAAPPVATADQIGLNVTQIEAIKQDPGFNNGDYYDFSDGSGPHKGLALARRMALLNYRGESELNARFSRSWQSSLNPMGGGGRFTVESYLDFQGNKFTRRFDANSYITLVTAMNSHDICRDRGSLTTALNKLTMPSLILGITTDRLFAFESQQEIAKHVPGSISGQQAVMLDSEYGHDGFLIEQETVSIYLRTLLNFPTDTQIYKNKNILPRAEES